MSNIIISFRKDVLDGLKPSTKRYYVTDPKTPGLRLAVYESGIKTFILSRKVNGVSQRIKIGRYDILSIEQARKKAKDLNAQIELGGDPHKEKIAIKAALTFKDLYQAYYDQYAVKFTKRPEDNKKILENHFLPGFANKKANSISQQEIRAYHTKIGQQPSRYSTKDKTRHSHELANRIIAIVSAVYNFGDKEGLLDCENPCKGIKKVKAVSRDRFLSRVELEKFWTALNFEAPIIVDLFKVLLFTGARKSNVLAMMWADINFDLKQWRIPETHTKNKDVNVVSLSEPAIEILTKRLELNQSVKFPSAFVFPGDGKRGHFIDLKRPFSRIKKRMGVSDIRIHDLRRTLGSYMAISGTSLSIIGKALNHKSHVSTTIYARLSHDPILEAVNTAAGLMSPSKVAADLN